MGFKLNLTNDEIKEASKSSNFEPIPEGVYGAVIYTAVEGQSKAKNDMYTIDFKITDGATAIGRKQRGWFTIAPQALFSIIGLHKAIGFPYPNKDTPAGEFEFPDADEYLGHKVNILINQTPFDSVDEETGEAVVKYQSNVKRVYAYDPDKVTGVEVESADSGLFLK